MKNSIKYPALIILILAAASGTYVYYQKSATLHESEHSEQTNASRADYRRIPYQIDGSTVTLEDGKTAVEAISGSASKKVTTYFGNEASGDLNGDGQADIAFLLTQNTGGSGTFFYAVAALQTEHGFTGTNAVLIGDRIAPQNTEIKDGQIIVNYAERKAGEPMTTQPSVGVSKRLKIENGSLIETR